VPAVLCQAARQPARPVAAQGVRPRRQPRVRARPIPRPPRAQVSDQYNLKWRWDWIIADFWRAPARPARPAAAAAPDSMLRVTLGLL